MGRSTARARWPASPAAEWAERRAGHAALDRRPRGAGHRRPLGACGTTRRSTGRAADLIAVRSTWDYDRRCGEFLGWARRSERGRCSTAPTSSRGTPTRATWSTSDDGLPVVPTRRRPTTAVPTFAAAVERFGHVVVKPRIGAGGPGRRGRRPTAGLRPPPRRADRRPLGRPAAGRVGPDHDGETSVFVIDGHAVVPGRQAAVRRRDPGARAVRRYVALGRADRRERRARRARRSRTVVDRSATTSSTAAST